jgi:oligo-alginate lyase
VRSRNHPYLLLHGVDLKTKAEKCGFIWNPILEKADADITSPPFVPENPEGWLWEILDKTKERILRGCIVYKVTGDERYLNSMKKQLWCLIDEWPWIENFCHKEIGLEADLRTGIIMFTLGLVYDWMYDDFSAFETNRLLSAIVDKGYPMLKKDIKADAFYLTSFGNNWLAVMLGGYAVAAYATMGECAFSQEIINLALERTQIMATYVGDDGAWEEGPFYWGGIAFLILFFDIVGSVPDATTNLLHMDRLEKTSMFPIYMNMPSGGRANFSDAHYYQDHNASFLFSVMARSAQNKNYQWAFK